MNKCGLFFLILSLIVCVGCFDVKEKPQNADLSERTVVKKEQKTPIDSSRIVRLKDIDPLDSVMVGIRAFRVAKKEFVKRWHYNKNTDLFIDIVDRICVIEKRPCASMLDSVEYKNDVRFILDSLMENSLLDSLVEARKVEMNDPCFGANYKKNEKRCSAEISKEVYEQIMEKRKRIK